MSDPTNSDDILDSRDIIARIEELADLCETCAECGDTIEHHEGGPDTCGCGEGESPILAGDEDDAEELRVLRELASECEGCADWAYGEALIRESYFVTYAQDFADSIGATPDDGSWPGRHIDWDAAAAELRQDYMEVDYNGVAYLIRCY